MEKIVKIEVDTDNFREVGSNDWDKIEKELKCSTDPHDPNSLRLKYPHLFKHLMSVLNQIKDIANEKEYAERVKKNENN